MTRMKLKKLLKVLPDDEMIVINEWVPRGRCVRRDGDCDGCEHDRGESIGCDLHADMLDRTERYNGKVEGVPISLACKKVVIVSTRGKRMTPPFEKLNDMLMIEVENNRG